MFFFLLVSADFELCLFKELTSSERGGAILISNQDSEFSVSRSVFVSCSASISGGAIYQLCNASVITNCRFVRCAVPHHTFSGQGIYSDTCFSALKSSDVTECPEEGQESLIFIGGEQAVHSMNSTRNTASQYASGIATIDSTMFTFRFTVIYEDKSPNHVIALVMVDSNDNINHINIINCSVSDDGLLFLSGTHAIISESTMIGNTGKYFCFSLERGHCGIILSNCFVDSPLDGYEHKLIIVSPATSCRTVVTASNTIEGELSRATRTDDVFRAPEGTSPQEEPPGSQYQQM